MDPTECNGRRDDGRPYPTLAQVATLAGVSVGTASKALNDRGKLRQETRDRVADAATRLGFRANALAQGLHSGRSYTVGLITGDSFGRFSIPVLLGAEDALSAGRISVFLADSRDDLIRERHYVSTLLRRRVDGFIVTSRLTNPREPLPLRAGVPVVYAFAPSVDDDDASVVPDDAGGAREAVRLLCGLGARRIGHVTGPVRHTSAATRATAAERALHDAGRQLVTGAPLFGEWSEEWGRQAAHLLVGAEPRLDAVFCGSDQVARGVIDGLRDHGRRVPDDVGVVGYDNWDVMATGRRPALTTVDQNLGDLGRSAAGHLLAAIDGSPHRGVEYVAPRLVIRESTDPSTGG